jgi:hypothetical protein
VGVGSMSSDSLLERSILFCVEVKVSRGAEYVLFSPEWELVVRILADYPKGRIAF